MRTLAFNCVVCGCDVIEPFEPGNFANPAQNSVCADCAEQKVEGIPPAFQEPWELQIRFTPTDALIGLVALICAGIGIYFIAKALEAWGA